MDSDFQLPNPLSLSLNSLWLMMQDQFSTFGTNTREKYEARIGNLGKIGAEQFYMLDNTMNQCKKQYGLGIANPTPSTNAPYLTPPTPPTYPTYLTPPTPPTYPTYLNRYRFQTQFVEPPQCYGPSYLNRYRFQQQFPEFDSYGAGMSSTDKGKEAGGPSSLYQTTDPFPVVSPVPFWKKGLYGHGSKSSNESAKADSPTKNEANPGPSFLKGKSSYYYFPPVV